MWNDQNEDNNSRKHQDVWFLNFFKESIDSQTINLNHPQSTSHTRNGNSAEVTEEIKTLTENNTLNSSHLQSSQIILNPDAFYLDARYEQSVLLPQIFKPKEM